MCPRSGQLTSERRATVLVLVVFCSVATAACDDSSADRAEDAGVGSGGVSSGGGGSGGSGGQGAAAGQAGADAVEPWAGCPDATAYASVEGWPHELEVTPGAVYCARFDEGRTLKQELAAKAQLRVAPGSYRLPGAAQAGLGLPACLRLGETAPALAVTAGSLSYQSSNLGALTSHTYFFEQFVPDPERRLRLGLFVTFPSEQGAAFVLDGSAGDPFDDTSTRRSFVLCQTSSETCLVDRAFDICRNDGFTLNRHDVVLDTGAVSLELRIGSAPAGTEPATFERASGSFRGRAFDQQNYFKLIYRPSHHHFERFFAVLFDQPIDGACGLEIAGLEPFDDLTANQAFSVDCELNRRDTLTVVSETLTVVP